MERTLGGQPSAAARFQLEPFVPAYLQWPREALLERAAAAREELRRCRVCPRDCDVDRLDNAIGLCQTGRYARVASAFPHFGEEDVLRGTRGSGTIFFGACNLRCVFCQNWDISQRPAGPEFTAEGIAEVMLELQDAGCHNINFVTPEHVAPQVIEAIAAAVPRGLRLPIVYNTSGYDSLASLRLLDGLIDIYMPDFKFWAPATARRFVKAEDYPETARAAIREMHRQVGPLRFGPNGLARRGLLVRHLVMPGLAGDSAAILRWIAEALGPDTYVNIMEQYRPEHRVGTKNRRGDALFTEIARRPATAEFDAAVAAARAAGLWRLDARED